MASYMKEKEDFWCSFFYYFWFCIYFSFLLAHLKTWKISNANSPNKKKLCFGALARPIKGKHIKFTRHSAVDGTCAAPMKAKRKQIGGWKENYEIKGQIYGTTFSCQQALNCTHYCHCVALSIPKHCDLLEAWFANSTTWTHFSQYHKSTDFISGTNALSSRNAYMLSVPPTKQSKCFFYDNYIFNMYNAAETSHGWFHIWHSAIQAAGEGVWETDKGERIEGQFQNHTVLHLFLSGPIFCTYRMILSISCVW